MIDAERYTHPADKAALNALKAIPGFTQLLKAFMSVWNEKQFRIINMSSNLRLGENQLSKYYNMLPPICEKLGIEVPELYLSLDVKPNAYTYGDTKPFIVLTSGLLEQMPDRLIPTVLAHECGHIACHHTLYRTMGQIIVNGSSHLPGLTGLVSLPLQVAFYYWMRCSEFSADRAAAVCDGHADNIIEMCMRFAGYVKAIEGTADKQLFMEQAVEYRELIGSSAWNKTLEFMMLSHNDHPFNAVRAWECNEWAASPAFMGIGAEQLVMNVIQDPVRSLMQAFAKEPEQPQTPEKPQPQAPAMITDGIVMYHDLAHYVGMDKLAAQVLLEQMGFRNIALKGTRDRQLLTKPGQVTAVTIDGARTASKGSVQSANAPVVIVYYDPEQEQGSPANPLNLLKFPFFPEN